MNKYYKIGAICILSILIGLVSFLVGHSLKQCTNSIQQRSMSAVSNVKVENINKVKESTKEEEIVKTAIYAVVDKYNNKHLYQEQIVSSSDRVSTYIKSWDSTIDLENYWYSSTTIPANIKTKKKIFSLESNFYYRIDIQKAIYLPSKERFYINMGRSLFIYDFKQNQLTIEIDDIKELGLDSKLWYFVYEVSNDGNYILLKDTPCINCGPLSYPRSHLYSINDKKVESIGMVTDFEWLSYGNYKYKEHILIPFDECDQEIKQENTCYKDSKDLPWKFSKL